MNSTKFRVEDIFGDVISKASISPEQITKKNFFSQNKMNNNFCLKIKLFKPKNKTNIDYSPSAPPYYE